ncbi:S8 family peptidase [Alteromonas lipotrueiana]|uniref:S8 family peptidase n=1 Tax=Alteromonas lipotrueiana TaxID=2803815 RepID=UPI001C437FBF|nr:S8 family peptidase [Alteromonas lipotrueiana]
MTEKKNKIKHVRFSDIDYIQPDRSYGGSSKPHKEVTDNFIIGLLSSIDELKVNLENIDKSLTTGVTAAVVELEENAIAKTNRPNSIFSDKSCPFFGDIGHTKFLIKVTESGLESLKSKISQAKNTKKALKEVSAIKSIHPYRPRIELSDDSNQLSVRLFRFNSQEDNSFLDSKFEDFLNSNEFGWYKHRSNSIRLYRVEGNPAEIVSKLNQFLGVQSATSSKCIKIKPMVGGVNSEEQVEITPPSDVFEYPIVAVVDSGISDSCKPLEPWLVGRNSYVAAPYRDASHGTFVAGLICDSHNLNGRDVRFPLCQAKVFSVEVLGNEHGDMYEIINAMYEVAEQNPDIKVWNLSLGASTPVSMSEISAMALLLDEFQDRYDCICVVAAGNFEDETRAWPPNKILNDGISSPGDSVRSITVGSLAHVDGFVKNEEPSHFSRKGPVSNFVQKPEVVHYGGNITIVGGRPLVLGVNSVDISGYSRNDIGTSFSTPVISAITANLFQALGDRANVNLVKALIVHSANTSYPTPIEYRPYFGWGVPQSSSSLLSVSDFETTVVFEGQAKESFEINKLPFPIPSCLRTPEGKVRAEFFITLVYTPELDPNKAFEYCQVDLQLGLGKYDQTTGKFNSKVPLQTSDNLYEHELVKNGDKWSPVKVYHARFPQGVDIDTWKLRLTVLGRDGYSAPDVAIPFSVVLTIRDLDAEQPVYNEMVRLMNDYNWEVSDLVLDQRIQL